MSEPVSRDLFEQHQKHVDQRFDNLEEVVRSLGKHEHPEKVGWAGLVGTLLTAAGIAAAVVSALP